MFNLLPFLYNNRLNNNKNYNNYSKNNNYSYNPFNVGYSYDIFSYLLSDEFINGITNEVLNNDSIVSIAEQLMQDDPYELEFKDIGDFYRIKGYLPGLTAKDVKIDFEKNKAILTIKRKQVYSNDSNFVAMFQSSDDVVKTFYTEEIDVSKLRASFNNNMLIIEMPKFKDVKVISQENVIVDVDNVVDVNEVKNG